MNLLDQHFERIAVISLAGREDRRTRCAAHLAELRLSRSVQWFDAVDGRSQPPPRGWNSGGPAWGCHRSHVTIMEEALRDRLHSVLILEDDAIFSPHTCHELRPFLKAVPDDWGQIYLGGQHLAQPLPTASPLVWRGYNVNRTHAYAVSGREAGLIVDFLNQWPARAHTACHHIDHHFGLAHRMRLWPAYCPKSWFTGQMEAVSDIHLHDPDLPERWWHYHRHNMQLPIVAVDEAETLTPEEENLLLFPRDGTPKPASRAQLYVALVRLATEAVTAGRLPAWRGSPAEHRTLRRIWHNPVLRLREARTLCPHQITNNTLHTPTP
jgi:Glycosyltransferase family 25 (LPS biosynthesis protein)